MILNKVEKANIEPRITLVGAGPGDADLFSLKGVKALKTADVVLYDANVNEALLCYAPEGIPKVFVGKSTDDEDYAQDAVNKLIIDYALNYGHVVRLKSGDPFFFAKGYEEIDAAESYSIPTEIIPGISSATGAPSLQKIPMIYKELSESFWAITGTNSKGELSEDLYTAAKTKATIVILNGIEKVEEIASIFQAENKGLLPVAVIQNGSTLEEKIEVGTVDTITEIVKDKNISAPALLVFGDVVSLHPKFNAIRDFYEAEARAY
ncbi:uroporphyrinogen-III C-methyltransferase [Pedobacter changchengzhani]|uniref:uroporphyrinogen-III C-methyltransferase n=1 Tax=Pedobacter changchengzhani TaxID=2529274 RepID=A0A4R5MMV8_9SPHI|nr:uroporphyrinogen-III C-methyltransferase [Pedobacter changchengzhani]TDG37034.1 uroporphyrinogen-III C-methyltransferase [Pedobacter changchengzhani]